MMLGDKPHFFIVCNNISYLFWKTVKAQLSYFNNIVDMNDYA